MRKAYKESLLLRKPATQPQTRCLLQTVLHCCNFCFTFCCSPAGGLSSLPLPASSLALSTFNTIVLPSCDARSLELTQAFAKQQHHFLDFDHLIF